MELLMEQWQQLLALLDSIERQHLVPQVLALVIAAVGAALAHHYLGRFLQSQIGGETTQGMRQVTLRSIQRIAFPISMLLVVLVVREVLRALGHAVWALDVAVPLLLSLAAIRFAVYLLRKGFHGGAAVKAWEHLISTSVWIVVALHLIGWLPGLLDAMDAMAFRLGNTRISLLAVVNLVLLVAVLMVLALWLSQVIERQVASSPHLSKGVAVGLAKVAKFFLISAAILLALDAVGIDLTALTVFGGALGVGLGFGLQRIASNFISGFILIFDRSIRPGDVVSVGDKFGWVQELRARYIVVRDRDGVETLIPNENLVTTDVINWSYTDRSVRLKIPVQVSYGDDPEQAMAIMLEATHACSRVLQDPEPVCRLMEFGDNGITLELRIWINDPENGVSNVRTDIYLAIWKAFQCEGITIPYPQRDLHLKSSDVPLTTSAD